MERYFVDYKGSSLQRAESLMRVVHQALSSYQITSGGKHQQKGKPAAAAPEPLQVAPAGSFLLRAAVHLSPVLSAETPQLSASADVVVTIPSTVCSTDDVQDGAYLVRREQFLANLKAHLLKTLVAADGSNTITIPEGTEEGDSAALAGATVSVATEPFHHSTVKSCIAVTVSPQQSPTANFRGIRTVRVHVRPAEVTAEVASKKAVAKHPLYSHLVMEDFLMIECLEKLHNVFSTCPSLFRAVLVLRVWMAHVGLCGFHGGLTGFVVSAMVLRLLEEGVIAASMTDDNIVRAVWVQLSRGAFSTETTTQLPLAGHHINVLFRSSPTFLNEQVRAAAEAAIRFATPAELFFRLPHTPFTLRGDVSFRVANLPSIAAPALATVMKEKLAAEPQHAVEAKVLDFVRRALGDRAASLSCVAARDGTTAILSFKVPRESDARSRLVRGPSIEDEAGVAAFNDFWGADRVSTRQFPDGGINRCIIFDNKSVDPAAVLPITDVLGEIITYIIDRHIAKGARADAMLDEIRGTIKDCCGGAWVDVAGLSEHTLRAAGKEVKGAIEALGPAALPCKVTSFDFIAPAMRSTEVFGLRPHLSLLLSGAQIPQFATAASSIEPIHCVLGIDDKHKIPDNIEAIAKMKGALCAQLCKAMQQRFVSFCTSSSVDIITHGFLFRVFIAHYREVSLLNALQRQPEAELLERKLFWATRHAAFIESLSNGHPAFGYTVRLAKRWVGAMLMSDFLMPEAVELLVAYVFQVGEQAGNAPMTPTSGFVRWIELLATFNWQSDVLIFPFVDGVEARRNRADHASMWIASPYAPEVSPFTKTTPRALVMQRLVHLASSTQTLLARALAEALSVPEADRGAVIAGCFRPELSEFDFALHLAPELLLHPGRALTVSAAAGPARLTLRRMWHLDELRDAERQKYVHQLAELDPAGQCVKTLRAHTRDSCMVFHDAVGPSTVGVVLLATQPTDKQRTAVLRTIHQALPGAFSDLPALPAQQEKKEPQHPSHKLQRQQPAASDVTPGKRSRSGAPASEQKAKDEAASPSSTASPRGSATKAPTPATGEKRKQRDSEPTAVGAALASSKTKAPVAAVGDLPTKKKRAEQPGAPRGAVVKRPPVKAAKK